MHSLAWRSRGRRERMRRGPRRTPLGSCEARGGGVRAFVWLDTYI